MSHQQSILDAAHLQPLSKALMGAFISWERFERELNQHLSDHENPGGDLHEMASSGEFRDQVYRVLKDAMARGNARVVRILRASRRAAAENEEILRLVNPLLPPMAVTQKEVNDLAARLGACDQLRLRELRDCALRCVRERWPVLTREEVHSAYDLLELLAEHPVIAGQVHPLLAFTLTSAFERDGDAEKKFRRWCEDVCDRRRWSRQAMDALVARLTDPPWRTGAVRVVCCDAAGGARRR